jgi:hypothetical protein
MVSAPASVTTTIAGAVLTAVLSLSVLATLALFTDASNPSVGNTFSSAKVDMTAGSGSVLFTAPSLIAGETVTTPVTVTNTGTIALRYAIKSTTSENSLAAQLDLQIKSGVTDCSNDGFALSGSTRYGPADVGSTTGINVVGNPTVGADTGDRTLAANTNEILCMQVSVPFTINASFQGATTTATFDFIGEQASAHA